MVRVGYEVTKDTKLPLFTLHDKLSEKVNPHLKENSVLQHIQMFIIEIKSHLTFHCGQIL